MGFPCLRWDGRETFLSLTWGSYIGKTTSLYWDAPIPTPGLLSKNSVKVDVTYQGFSNIDSDRIAVALPANQMPVMTIVVNLHRLYMDCFSYTGPKWIASTGCQVACPSDYICTNDVCYIRLFVLIEYIAIITTNLTSMCLSNAHYRKAFGIRTTKKGFMLIQLSSPFSP